MAFTILFILLGVLGISCILGCYFEKTSNKNAAKTLMDIMICIAGTILIWLVVTIIYDCWDDKKAKEFPAAKYELKYKVTEFDGVSDTTYVIVPKNNE